MKPLNEQALTADAIAQLQARAWARTYTHVFEHSPFYRLLFRDTGLTLADAPGLEDLPRLPTTDKQTISEQPDSFLCVPESEIVDLVTTSGSTGQPLVWKLTDADLERLAWNEFLSFRCAGFSPADTVLLAVTLDRCFIAGMAYFLGLRKVGCGILRVGPAASLMHLDLLRRVRASAIVGVPSFLGLLANKAAEAGLDLPALGVRKLVCIGEPIRDTGFALNKAGVALEQSWQGRVFSTYGITELAASLCECPAGCGGHLHPEFLFVEALDDEGNRVPDGEVGELTATTFGVQAMPLVRYRTGDYTALYRDPCPCGRQTPRIGPIVGRKHHKLKLKGTTLFPSNLKSVLDATSGITAYVIIARTADALCDCVEVKIACPNESANICRALRERFRGEAKVVPDITVASPGEIESLQMPEGARKRRYFVDLRAQAS